MRKFQRTHTRESFLKRFHLTAQEAFGAPWQSRVQAAKVLTEIARAHFKSDAPYHDLYNDLRVVWNNMRRSKMNRWHGNIDTVEMDFEEDS